MACVRKRRGRWVTDFRDAAGKRHWQSFSTRKQAEAALHGQQVAIKGGTFIDNDRRTVGEAYDSWLHLCVHGAQNKTRKPLRLTTQAIYEMTWRKHVATRWGAYALKQVDTEAVQRWQQGMVDAGTGPKTIINAMQLLGSIFRHARAIRWTAADPLSGVMRPLYQTKVHAFTAAEIGALIAHADASTALLIRLAASTGARFGELAGLRWSCVDLEARSVRIEVQFTHGHWSAVKTANGRRTIPISVALAKLLRAHRAELDGKVTRLPGSDDRLVFSAPGGAVLDYHNFRDRRWSPLCKAAGVTGTFHMLRHSFATALIQSGESAPTVAKLVGHARPSFTMDVYADAWPDAVSAAGEKVAALLFADSGSKTVAEPNAKASKSAQLIDVSGAPGEIRTPDPLVRSQVLYPSELRARCLKLLRSGGLRPARRLSQRAAHSKGRR
jgi:integrase